MIEKIEKIKIMIHKLEMIKTTNLWVEKLT